MHVKSRARIFKAPARALEELPEGKVRCGACSKPVKVRPSGIVWNHKHRGYWCVSAYYNMREEIAS